MMFRKIQFSIFAVLLLTLVASGADRFVPGGYSTIQSAVNDSNDGDRIIVGTGTYHENIGIEKGITLMSVDPNDPNIVANTIIDAGGSSSAITFSGLETVYDELRGFTITGGRSGGIKCEGGNITIANCVITNNGAYTGSGKGGGVSSDSFANLTIINCDFIGNTAEGYGGGIFVDQGELTLIGCEFIQNVSGEEGGAVATDYQQVTIQDCVFKANEAVYGGAVHNSHYAPTITNCVFYENTANYGGAICQKEFYLGDLISRISNCTFYGNIASEYGGAVSIRQSGNMVMSNCILWDNISFVEGPQISGGHSGDITVSYSCIQGGQWDIYEDRATLNWLTGNIEVDPILANPTSGDFHLQSTTGRWDKGSSSWVVDSSHSPCIDAGDPTSNWAEEVWPNGQRINMGAFGGTTQASKSLATSGNIADINSSGAVDEVDLNLLVGKWLSSETALSEDLDGDGIVNLKDFAILASNWGWSE